AVRPPRSGIRDLRLHRARFAHGPALGVARVGTRPVSRDRAVVLKVCRVTHFSLAIFVRVSYNTTHGHAHNHLAFERRRVASGSPEGKPRSAEAPGTTGAG